MTLPPEQQGAHTGGPWKFECGDHTHRYVLITDCDDLTVFYKYGSGTAKEADTDEVRGRLAAAAPVLLSSLREMLEMGELFIPAKLNSPGFVRARAAISLAEGKS